MTSETERALRACILRLLIKGAEQDVHNKGSKGELHMTWRPEKQPGRLRTARLSGAMSPEFGFTGTLPEMLDRVSYALATSHGQLICRTMLTDMHGHRFTGVVLIASAVFWDESQGSLVKPAPCLIGIGVQLDTGTHHAMHYNTEAGAASDDMTENLGHVTEQVWALAETMDNMRHAPMPENAFELAADLLTSGSVLNLGTGHTAYVPVGIGDDGNKEPVTHGFREQTREYFMARLGAAALAAGVDTKAVPPKNGKSLTAGNANAVVENLTRPQPDLDAGPVRYRP